MTKCITLHVRLLLACWHLQRDWRFSGVQISRCLLKWNRDVAFRSRYRAKDWANKESNAFLNMCRHILEAADSGDPWLLEMAGPEWMAENLSSTCEAVDNASSMSSLVVQMPPTSPQATSGEPPKVQFNVCGRESKLE